ncbi:hypothetical protein [Desulfosporosinus sp. OT]|uniref:hypothetical protein n=1 Tax=Desulfosporosinus sp. OT TaxID=913865 RepID=UPI000223ABDC|nr:hypothetical protein [Desulfosporosinus sp. OT]EGW40321.1 hypothetical protein DOT_1660 [Desulfosporosinus sp. OT]
MIAQIEKELGDLQKQIDSLDNLLEQGVYSIEKYTARSSKLNEAISKQEEVLKQLEKANEQIIRQSVGLPIKIKLVTHVIQGYKETDDITIKNKLLKEILKKAVYYRETRSNKGIFKLKLDLHQM